VLPCTPGRRRRFTRRLLRAAGGDHTERHGRGDSLAGLLGSGRPLQRSSIQRVTAWW
jgi:hypothetical protein